MSDVIQKCCETCRHDLGGGYDNCKINVEAECAAGGFEAWEPKDTEYDTGYDMESAARIFAQALASTGVMSKDIIGVALSRPLEQLFDTEEEGEEA